MGDKILIGLKDGEARLEPHSNEWNEIAKDTMNKLKNILGDVAVDIQHVGSTSIVGLMAKPIIDIEVGVNSIQDVIYLIPLLKENGFIYRPRMAREEHILFACRDFSHGMDTHYIHVVIYGNNEWNNNIKFRDILNENPDIRKEYEDLKLQLANEYPKDRVTYTNMKAEFIQNIMNV